LLGRAIRRQASRNVRGEVTMGGKSVITSVVASRSCHSVCSEGGSGTLNCFHWELLYPQESSRDWLKPIS
jgi:hypothetical protein